MTRRLTLVSGCFIFFFVFSSIAMADSITFTFAIHTQPVLVTASGGPGGSVLMAGPVGDVVVKNQTPIAFSIPDGWVSISSHNDMTYNYNGVSLDALYAGTTTPGVDEVLVTSTALCGGTCLSGDLNWGMYFGRNGDGGGWGGIFKLTYVSPAILALFGDEGLTLNPYGSDTFTTTNNSITSTGVTAEFGSGSITIETTPEPGTLLLIGTGILGLAESLRRK